MVHQVIHNRQTYWPPGTLRYAKLWTAKNEGWMKMGSQLHTRTKWNNAVCVTGKE